MNENDNVFLKLMKGVNPIKKNNRIEKKQPKLKKKINTKLDKIEIAQFTKKSNQINTKKSQFSLEKVDIKKNIKKGSLKIEKKIDFHGKTVLDSEERFTDSVLSCYNQGFRCLLFVTGKGLFKVKDNNNSTSPKLYHGVIRSAFTDWVRSKKLSKYILSFEPASIEHGGDGAFYVYKKKKKN